MLFQTLKFRKHCVKKKKRSFISIADCIKNWVGTILNSLNWNTFSFQGFETETSCETIHIRRLVWFILLQYSSSKQMYHFHNFQEDGFKIRCPRTCPFLRKLISQIKLEKNNDFFGNVPKVFVLTICIMSFLSIDLMLGTMIDNSSQSIWTNFIWILNFSLMNVPTEEIYRRNTKNKACNNFLAAAATAMSLQVLSGFTSSATVSANSSLTPSCIWLRLVCKYLG